MGQPAGRNRSPLQQALRSRRQARDHVGDRHQRAWSATIRLRIPSSMCRLVSDVWGVAPADRLSGSERQTIAEPDPEPMPADDEMLSPREVVRVTGISLSTIKRMVNRRSLP